MTKYLLSKKAQHKLGEKVYKELEIEFSSYKRANLSGNVIVNILCEICGSKIKKYYVLTMSTWCDYIFFKICNECFKKEIKVIESGKDNGNN